MIGYIHGEITFKCPTHVYIDINGLGYHVNISLNTFEKIKSLDETKLFTHLQVKEDSHTLFGFAEEKEKELFLLLVSISGIGASTAQTILSSLTINEVCKAILHEDIVTLNKIKGIGAKTAKRVVLELKDKILKVELADGEIENISTPSNTIKDEALSALLTLGFSKNVAEKNINSILKKQEGDTTVEELIRLALKSV